MGKIVLTCAKQTGGAAGGGLSAHIERQIWDEEQQKMVEFRPNSVKHPELTKLNKEYILPKGMGRSDALDDSHLKELEQEVSKKDQTLKSVNTSLHAFQTFAKELCTLLGSTPLSVSNAIHIIDTSGLTGNPAKAAMFKS